MHHYVTDSLMSRKSKVIKKRIVDIRIAEKIILCQNDLRMIFITREFL